MPVLIYDGDCAFCTWSAETGRRFLSPDVELLPWQKADLGAFELDEEAVTHSVQWVSPGRPPQAGHRAVASWMIMSGLPWSLVGRLLLVPPVSWLAAGAYRLVARNRHRIPGPWRRSGTCRT
jgi:predicted DCC family thiol-disulfide oxidoreductase YuxK